MKKLYGLVICVLVLVSGSADAKEFKCGYVNFQMCLEQSKPGKTERQNFESLKNQMQQTLEATSAELESLAKQIQDPNYLDSLSPTAEDELREKFSQLSQEFSRYQSQYYQLLNQANYKMFQSLHQKVSAAADHVREKDDLAFILNEESTFSVSPSLDVTSKVVVEMDRLYDLEHTEESTSQKKGKA